MYRGITFHDTAESCNIWRKTDLLIGKLHEEFGKFSPEHMKVSKLGISLGPFIQNRKCVTLNLTGELRVMTMHNDAKFEKKLLVSSKLTWGI